MYELLFQNEVKTYGSRLEAVTAAKELTVEDDGRMTCNVSDGVETLSFRGGKLIAYTYETRRNEARDRSQAFDDLEVSAQPDTGASGDEGGEDSAVATEATENAE